MRFVSHPTYLEAIGVSAEGLQAAYLHHWISTRASRMSDLVRMTAARVELGPLRLGFITLMAQTVPQTPLEEPHGRSTERAQFEVSTDIVAIAETLIGSEADKLQIGRTYWELGRLAKGKFLPDLSTMFYTKAAQIYVGLRRWSQVVDLYWNLGLAEAGTGNKGAAIGWLNLAAEVFRSLNDQQGAGNAIALAGEIRLHPSRYFVPSVQLKALLDAGAGTSPSGVLAEIYGLGVVAVSAVVPSAIDALLLAERFGDALLQFVDQEWPTGVIVAQAVDIRTISRIFAHPALLDNLEPRALETLVSVLFEGFGAEVELTKETRDGGFDVGATFELGDGRFKVLIEAKKWKQARKVGIAMVDRLIGVKHRLQADKVILVTTSTFSSVAHEAAMQLRCEIELVDRDGLSEWVAQYLLPASSGMIALPSLHPMA